MTFRSRKLLDAARDCTECMGCGRYHNDGSIVAAHSNQLRDGKGMGMKAADYRVAFLGPQCHAELDQGKNMNREEKVAFWERAHRKTMAWLFESGKVKVL